MAGSSSDHDAVTEREAKIIKQIENYFSDVNLLSDKFLQEKIQEDDGWVTTDTMLKFKRLRKITDDAQMICEALKKSSSGLMEVSEQGDKIRRSPSKPLPGNTKKIGEKIITRTVYAEPSPLDVSLLMKFFEGYPQVVNMWLFFLKNNISSFQRHNEKETSKRWMFDTFSNKEKAKEEETEADLEERVGQKMTRNAVLHLKGLDSKTSRQQVKTYFPNVLQSNASRVDIVKDATESYIRLREPDGFHAAGSTLEKAKTVNDGKVVIHDSQSEVRVVKSDEELQYWKKAFKDTADKEKGGDRDRRQGGRNQRDGRRNRGVQQGKRKHDTMEDSSDGEEQDTTEPPAKVIRSEMFIKFNEVMKLHNALSDGEEQDTKEPPAKVTKSDMIITGPQGKRKQNRTNASSDGEEQDTGEPLAKVIKSEMIITGPQGKRKQNRKDASSDGEEQDPEEPPAKVIKSDMIIKFNEVMKLHDASSDGEEQDTKEPPAQVSKSEMIMKCNVVCKLHDASSDGEKQDTKEQPAKVSKSEMIITGAQGKRKQQKGCFDGKKTQISHKQGHQFRDDHQV